MSDSIWCLAFSVRLTSLSMKISRSIHVASNGILFFFMTNSPLYICTILFNHFSVKEYLNYYHVLTMVNSASMNIGVCVYPFKLWFSLDIWSGIAGSYDSSISTFKEISILFFIVVVSIYIPTNSVGGFSFLHTLSSIYL